MQRRELCGVVGRAVVVDPGPADRELVEAEHVHHADRRQAPRRRGPAAASCRRRPAGRRSSPPEIASFVRAACTCCAISHSAAAMKSSKTFCFASFVPALCQASPYSPPPRRLGTAKMPPISIQTRFADAERGRQRDVEAAVAVEQRRVLTVELQALLVADEHRDRWCRPCSVEDLRRLDSRRGRTRPSGLRKTRALARGHVVAVDRRRRRERGEGVERLRVRSLAAEAAGRAEARAVHFADERAVESIHLDLGVRVLEIGGDEVIADHVDAVRASRRPRGSLRSSARARDCECRWRSRGRAGRRGRS